MEKKRPDDKIYPIDENMTNTLEDFLSHPPLLPIASTNTDEITDYVKMLPNNKARQEAIILPIKMTGRSTRVVFLDIQKAFDRVWVRGLIYNCVSQTVGNPPLSNKGDDTETDLSSELPHPTHGRTLTLDMSNMHQAFCAVVLRRH
ncbi:hypothetical protein TNCV_40501 [Trichonephila clavipes]|nr:hypothetical protein TNCV_40501 [Trichonephila clavipes]